MGSPSPSFGIRPTLLGCQDVEADFACFSPNRALKELDVCGERVQSTTTQQPKANITRKRFCASPLARSQASSSHSTQKKVFFDARASLHSTDRIPLTCPSAFISQIPRLDSPAESSSLADPNQFCDESTKLACAWDGSSSRRPHSTFEIDPTASPLTQSARPWIRANAVGRANTCMVTSEPASNDYQSTPVLVDVSGNLLFSAESKFAEQTEVGGPTLPVNVRVHSEYQAELSQSSHDAPITSIDVWLDAVIDESTCSSNANDEMNEGKPHDKKANLKTGRKELASLDCYSYPNSRKELRHPTPNISEEMTLQQIRPLTPESDTISPLSTRLPPLVPRRSRSGIQAPSTPVLYRKTQPCFNTPIPRRGRHLSPRKPAGSFTLPLCQGETKSPTLPASPRRDLEYRASQHFGIVEDQGRDLASEGAPDCGRVSPHPQLGFEIRELSPHVNPYRKGKGPKKSRRPSYYDEDLLQEANLAKDVESPADNMCTAPTSRHSIENP